VSGDPVGEVGHPQDPDDPLNGPDWWEHVGEPDDSDGYGHVPADHEDQAHVVAKTRAEMGGPIPDAEAPEWVRKNFPSVDWEAGFETDFSRVDWLPGKFLERGQQASLVGEGKAGKSLFALDWAFRMVSGRSFIGDTHHEPLRVLYLDRENSLRDVVTRAQALGARPADLSGLVYKQFPQFAGGLDVPDAKAGRQLAKLAEGYRADVVILDTVSRFITGKENEADTWLQLYQSVHERLKALGIACVRLDHFGKDAERGSRGSSAKTQDVDSVWELTRLNERSETPPDAPHLVQVLTTLKLARTHTRSGLGEDTFTIIRRGTRAKAGMWLPGRTRHELSDNGLVAQLQREVDVIVDELILSGVPKIRGRGTLTEWLKKTGRETYRNDLLADITRELKRRQTD
jgi:AAA domain-containing protein